MFEKILNVKFSHPGHGHEEAFALRDLLTAPRNSGKSQQLMCFLGLKHIHGERVILIVLCFKDTILLVEIRGMSG